MFKIIEVEKNSVVLSELVSELDEFQSALYPEESNHSICLSSVADESLRCIVDSVQPLPSMSESAVRHAGYRDDRKNTVLLSDNVLCIWRLL